MPGISASKIAIPFGRSFSWSSYWEQLKKNRNTDLVQVSSINALSTEAVYLYATANAVGDNVLITWRTDRIRQSGNLKKINLANIGSMVGVSKFEISIWRKDGATYDRVGVANLTSLLSAGLNSVTLPSPIAVLEGDFLAYKLMGDPVDVSNCLSATARVGGIRYTSTEDYTVINFDWDSKNGLNYAAHSHLFMQAPLICAIGDSIMESYPYHSSFVDTDHNQVDIPKCWTSLLGLKDSDIVYQNLGYGAQTTTAIAARFDSQVIAAKPKICIINAGLNDGFIDGSFNQTTFLSKMTEMLDKCRTNHIMPIVFTINAANTITNVSYARMRDTANIDLISLVSSYSDIRAKVYNTQLALGQFRVGGDANNLWDVKTAFDYGDGVHMNEAGNQRLADDIYSILSIGKQL
jgi:lysophospholipase L1-like esterase